MAFKPISISLSPNTEWDDIWLALKLIFCPWRWTRLRLRSSARQEKGEAILELEDEFKKYLGIKYAFAFNSGRSALLAILKSLDLEAGAEVLLQAFTCNAAINPILWAGLRPVYIDCNEDDFNINIEDLKRKITLRQAQGKAPKVLMVQHTFGLPANMDEILDLAERYNLILIEDCAHALGAEYGGKKVGTFSRAAFFSFGRDKVISSVYGGMAVTNDEDLAETLRQNQSGWGYSSHYWIFQQLLHPILLSFIILPIYNFLNLGKIFLVLSQWFNILSKAVHWKEKRGRKPDYFPKKMPNALAVLALHQFKKLEKFNKHREEISNFYYQELKDTSFELPPRFPERKNVFLRFTIKHPQAHQILYNAWHKQNILLGDWYTSPIAPYDTKLNMVKYKIGTCPKAEKLAKRTLNLPTHINISKKGVQKIIDFLKIWI
ncbi:MAG: aminotransferase class I/II-fold pyridoxal phosphate-dependent enzyme [Candidatus Nealsonbacteria bacterium]|nr:aminotransferase class I/II-fold pyridoxal phosphate-dependent enzyme [Candidatus Nealsonbacteria bacterium]